ncbi:hypothetical protein DAPPUDRAFT_255900 [Daphnia pulex]|uniref:Uncharacterized protein n=1 Tax=Daphnia pulex TaxID=6669 RepID=E9HAB4_DAPPU|nr:hypothetical protein DAPPUDRAFT_255900 [Daphnia pulex]|eukprot:EFX71276.1 hypothetical protein DAPPUDRAFT_255900 [Daphnia pulex]
MYSVDAAGLYELGLFPPGRKEKKKKKKKNNARVPRWETWPPPNEAESKKMTAHARLRPGAIRVGHQQSESADTLRAAHSSLCRAPSHNSSRDWNLMEKYGQHTHLSAITTVSHMLSLGTNFDRGKNWEQQQQQQQQQKKKERQLNCGGGERARQLGTGRDEEAGAAEEERLESRLELN